MKTKYSMMALRGFVKEFSDEVEDQGVLNDHESVRVPVGWVEYETSERETKEIPLCESFGFKTTVLAKLADGTSEIIVPIGFVDDPSFIPTLAHEIGHMEQGHLSEVPGERTYINTLTDKNKRLLKLQKETGSESDTNNYLRNIFIALLKGGYLVHEYEADLKALDYVTLNQLAEMHKDKLKSKNYSVRLEFRNRLVELASIKEPIVKKKLAVHQHSFQESPDKSFQFFLMYMGELRTPSEISKVSAELDIPDLDKMMKLAIEMPEEVKTKLTKHFNVELPK